MTGSDQAQNGRQNGGTVAAREVPAEGRARPSNTVLAALDSLPGYDPETSEQVLADSTDPYALDALFRSRDGDRRDNGRVVFSFAGFRITVEASGEVVVTESGSTGS
mgnify:CR=1 FL=1